jgi:hypothetical protein
MIYISSRKMELAIYNKAITSTQKFITIILFSLLFFPSAILKPSIIAEPYKYQLLDIINGLLFLGITIVSLIKCYKINKEIDDESLIERYFLLSFPILIRVIIFTLIGFIVFPIVFAKYLHPIIDEPYTIRILISVYGFIFGLYLYASLIFSFIKLKKLFKK